MTKRRIEAANRQAPKRLLIMDDDEDTAVALSGVLQRSGCRARRAANGDQGLRTAAAERPDLILLDRVAPAFRDA
jgi:DNA-binding response OmpR family regulator